MISSKPPTDAANVIWWQRFVRMLENAAVQTPGSAAETQTSAQRRWSATSSRAKVI